MSDVKRGRPRELMPVRQQMTRLSASTERISCCRHAWAAPFVSITQALLTLGRVQQFAILNWPIHHVTNGLTKPPS